MMIFQLPTLTPDSAVAASLLPIENVYRPRMVLARITPATTISDDEDEHAEREPHARDHRVVHQELEVRVLLEVDRLACRR